MSTRERAHKILDNMNEEQIAGFVSLFGVFDIASTVDRNSKSEKEKAYDELRGMIKSVPELDYDKELAEFREEKYGV